MEGRESGESLCFTMCLSACQGNVDTNQQLTPSMKQSTPSTKSTTFIAPTTAPDTACTPDGNNALPIYVLPDIVCLTDAFFLCWTLKLSPRAMTSFTCQELTSKTYHHRYQAETFMMNGTQMENGVVRLSLYCVFN